MNDKADNRPNIISCHAGETIISEGEVNEDMFKILKGNVELYIGYGTEKESLLGILGKDACFGEFGLLLKKPSRYTVIAYSDIILYRVVDEKIDEFIRENHSSVLQIMRSMANTMDLMQNQINQLISDLEAEQTVNRRFVDRNKEMLKNYIYFKK